MPGLRPQPTSPVDEEGLAGTTLSPRLRCICESFAASEFAMVTHHCQAQLIPHRGRRAASRLRAELGVVRLDPADHAVVDRSSWRPESAPTSPETLTCSAKRLEARPRFWATVSPRPTTSSRGPASRDADTQRRTLQRLGPRSGICRDGRGPSHLGAAGSCSAAHCHPGCLPGGPPGHRRVAKAARSRHQRGPSEG